MRSLEDFEVGIVTSDDEVIIVQGERDNFMRSDISCEEAYIPLKLSWESESHLSPMPLMSQIEERRDMGPWNLIYGSLDFSDPSSDRWAEVRFDFREYPPGSFDIFELELSENVWYVEYTNLKGQIEYRLG